MRGSVGLGAFTANRHTGTAINPLARVVAYRLREIGPFRIDFAKPVSSIGRCRTGVPKNDFFEVLQYDRQESVELDSLVAELKAVQLYTVKYALARFGEFKSGSLSQRRKNRFSQNSSRLHAAVLNAVSLV